MNEEIQRQLYPERFDGLPRVVGRTLTTSHDDFTRACRLLIQAEQAKVSPNNALLSVLCDAVRLSREHCDAMSQDGSCQHELNRKWVEKEAKRVIEKARKQAIADATVNRFPCGCLLADALLCTHGNSPLA